MSKTQQHPYYHEDIDFTALAAEDEDFAALLRQNDGRIDWQDPSAIQYAPRHPSHPIKPNQNQKIIQLTPQQTTNPLPPRPRLLLKPPLPPPKPPLPPHPRPLELHPLAPRPARHNSTLPHRHFQPHQLRYRSRHRSRRLMHLLAASLRLGARLENARDRYRRSFPRARAEECRC